MRIAIFIGLLLTLVIFTGIQTCAAAEPLAADYLLFNGRIFTVDDHNPWAEAAAVKGNMIIFVGSNDDAKQYIAKETTVIDLKQKLVLPGLIDSHVHPVMSAALASGIAIKDNSSIAGVLRDVRQYIETHPEKDAYFGFGWDNNLFPAQGPTKELLDEISPDKPVILLSNDGHAGWMNSAAIYKAGITKDFPDPVPGIAEFIRDKNGNPTGAIKETASIIVIQKLNLMSAQDMAEGAKTLFGMMSRLGITGVFDAGTFNYSIKESYRLLDTLVRSDELPFRYFGSYLATNNAEASVAVDELAQMAKQYNSDRLRINTLKLVTDGTLETRKAAFFAPYLDTGVAPDIIFDKKIYHDTVIDAAAYGFDIHIHAIGDKAVHEALEAAAAVRKVGYDDTRITLCHVQVWRDEDRDKFKAAKVFVNFTGSWIYSDTKLLQYINQNIYTHQYRYKVLAADGVTITQGSDFPAAETFNPFENIEMSHTRTAVATAGKKPEALMPFDERLPLELAVRTYTINAARQVRMEDKIGSIQVGKYADIIVLDKNIFKIQPAKIHSALPVLVMMDGKIRFDARN